MARCRQYPSYFPLTSLSTTAVDEIKNSTLNEDDTDFEPSESLLQDCIQFLNKEYAQSLFTINNNHTLYVNNDSSSIANPKNILQTISQISMEESNYNAIDKVNSCKDTSTTFLCAATIPSKYNLQSHQLWKSLSYTTHLRRSLTPPYIDAIIGTKHTNWITMRKNKGTHQDLKIPQITMELDKESWINSVAHSLKYDNLPSIPIAIKKDKDYLVEWIKIIRIKSQNVYIGLRFKYEVDETLAAIYCCGDRGTHISYPILDIVIDYCQELVVSAIELDLDYIGNHRLFTSKCNDDYKLSQFRPWITDLHFV